MPPGSLETVKDGKEVCNIMITPTSLVAMQQWDFRLFHWLFPTNIFSEGLKVMKSGCQVEHGPMTCWTPAVLLTVPRFQINRGLNIPTQGCCLEGCSWKIDAQTCSSARPAAEFFVTRKKKTETGLRARHHLSVPVSHPVQTRWIASCRATRKRRDGGGAIEDIWIYHCTR
jgi:hypothetical protein